MSFKLDFLTPGKKYKAEIYRDGDDADYRTDKRHSIIIESKDADERGQPGSCGSPRAAALRSGSCLPNDADRRPPG